MTVQNFSSSASLVAVYLDWQNVSVKQNQVNCLVGFISSIGSLEIKKVYALWDKGNRKSGKLLHKFGFDCLDVPCIEKNGADQKLIADCKNQALNNPAIKTVILISGDGDFAPLVRELKAKGKEVIVIARFNVSQKLIKIADKFYDVNELCIQAA